ncbi:MAG: polysaccharide biosynthesis protein [Bacteroidaceae bacterium]|nr:polysaccharide biosynthesis protein [Bacteroidaceae bacterium]
MNATILKFSKFKILNRYIVWGFDMIISLSSLLLSFLFINYLLNVTLAIGLIWQLLLVGAIATGVWTVIFRVHDGVIRHTTTVEMFRIVKAMFFKSLTLLLFSSFGFFGFSQISFHVYSIIIGDFFISVVLLILWRIMVQSFYHYVLQHTEKAVLNTLVYGTGEDSLKIASFLRGVNGKYRMLGFISRHPKRNRYRIYDTPIYYGADIESIDKLVRSLSIDCMMFANSDDLKKNDDLLNYGLENKLSMRIVPASEMTGEHTEFQLRSIQIEDLLGRDEIKIDLDEIHRVLHDKIVMVTGAAGSIGSELCRQLIHFDIKQLVVVDFSETGVYNIDMELRCDLNAKNVFSVIADVRNRERVETVIKRTHPNIIFHAAAYKHVPLMESYPCEAVIDNVLGTKNVADMALKYHVDKFVMISTDKAVKPSNVMGATKRVAETYVQSLGKAEQDGKVEGKTAFVTTRFGNVLGSNGSVIPLFRKQIEKGGPVTVTHQDIIRYFMSIPEACRLVLEAVYLGTGNDLFIFDMGEPVKIDYLARKMIELSGLRPDIDIKIVYTGLRPGEKLYEELLYQKENTLPTNHSKIFHAKSINYEYDKVSELVDRLISTAMDFDKVETVKIIKAIVPDYKSQNSVYEKLDGPKESETKNKQNK